MTIVSPSLSVITLNVNSLTSPVKTRGGQNGLKTKQNPGSHYMLSIRGSF